MIKDEVQEILHERFAFVLNDAKTYIYVRNEGLNQTHGLGGGNFTMAYSLFALLNLIAKVHYYLHKPNRFATDDLANNVKELQDRLLATVDANDKKLLKDYLQIPRLMQVNEQDAFIELGHELESNNIPIRLAHAEYHEDLKTIWGGFRNMLAHLATVQSGKGVMAYELKTSRVHHDNLEVVMRNIRDSANKFPPFFYDITRSAWIFSVDAMTSILPKIESMTCTCVRDSSMGEEQLHRLMLLLKPD